MRMSLNENNYDFCKLIDRILTLDFPYKDEIQQQLTNANHQVESYFERIRIHFYDHPKLSCLPVWFTSESIMFQFHELSKLAPIVGVLIIDQGYITTLELYTADFRLFTIEELFHGEVRLIGCYDAGIVATQVNEHLWKISRVCIVQNRYIELEIIMGEQCKRIRFKQFSHLLWDSKIIECDHVSITIKSVTDECYECDLNGICDNKTYKVESIDASGVTRLSFCCRYYYMVA